MGTGSEGVFMSHGTQARGERQGTLAGGPARGFPDVISADSRGHWFLPPLVPFTPLEEE